MRLRSVLARLLHPSNPDHSIMQPNRIADRATHGTTRVLGCCTFAWSETNGKRVVVIPQGAHASCLAELERAAVAQGIYLAFVHEDMAP